MAQLQRINLTKTDLDRIPRDERFFYVVAGHLANEVSILDKLLIIGANSLDREGPPGEAPHVQQILLIRLLAGRLHEARVFIAAHYHGKKLHKKCEAHLNEEARDALRNWCKDLSNKRPNLITPIRQTFAVHIDREKIEKTYEDLNSDFSLVHYISMQYNDHNLLLGARSF